MINLEDHVKEFEGVEYVPLVIATAAVAAGINESKLDDAMLLIKKSVDELNNGLKTIAEDD